MCGTLTPTFIRPSSGCGGLWGSGLPPGQGKWGHVFRDLPPPRDWYKPDLREPWAIPACPLRWDLSLCLAAPTPDTGQASAPGHKVLYLLLVLRSFVFPVFSQRSGGWTSAQRPGKESQAAWPAPSSSALPSTGLRHPVLPSGPHHAGRGSGLCRPGGLGLRRPGRIAVLALTPGSIQTDPPLNSSARLPTPHRGDGDACRLAPRGKYQYRRTLGAGDLECLKFGGYHAWDTAGLQENLGRLCCLGGGGVTVVKCGGSVAAGALGLSLPCLDPRGRSVTPKLQDLPTLCMRLPLWVTPAFECVPTCVFTGKLCHRELSSDPGH